MKEWERVSEKAPTGSVSLIKWMHLHEKCLNFCSRRWCWFWFSLVSYGLAYNFWWINGSALLQWKYKNAFPIFDKNYLKKEREYSALFHAVTSIFVQHEWRTDSKFMHSYWVFRCFSSGLLKTFVLELITHIGLD